jgi:hypothetical protein
LVDTLEAERTGVTLVNLNPNRERVVTVQGGAYAEHALTSVSDGRQTFPLGANSFEVRLAPGCGVRLDIAMRRYASAPTLKFPWNA